MLKVKLTRTLGFVAAAALLALLVAGLALWPADPAQAQDEEPPPVANLKCEAKADQVRFSWDIPQWSGGEIKYYDVVVTLPNGNRFTQRRHYMLRSRTDRGNWQIGDETRIVVKALYDLPGGERVSSAATELVCYVGPPHLLTITLDSATREYGGTDDLSYTVSGLKAGHAVEDVVVDGEVTREPGDDPGTYAMSLGTVAVKPAYARKYRLSKVADYTITPRPAAYTATGIGKVYDGTTQGPTGPGGSFAAGDIIAGDQVTVNAGGSVFASADAGTNIAITGHSLAGADAGNYDVTFDVTGNITPRAITGISDVRVHGRVTDSTTKATFDTSRAEGTGVLPGELADFRAGGLAVTGAFPKATAGTHDLKVTYSLSDHGSFKASNYSLSSSAAAATLKGQIRNPTPITAVSGVKVNTRLADGTTNATFDTSHAQGNGVPPSQLSDFRAGGLQVTGAFPNATAGTHDVSVTYSLQDYGSFKASEYSLSSTIAAATLKGVIRGNSAPSQSPDQQRHVGRNDYDTDDDHLIEISSLRQLYALHVDSGGGGSVRGSWASDYHWAFPDPQDGMGCPQGNCIGYELTADLDFDTNGNGRIDPGDDYYNGVHYPDASAYCQDWYQDHPVQSTKDQAGTCDDYWGNDAQGWRPLSQLGASRSYWGVFEGNGHTIRNLYINTLDPPYTEEQLNQVNIYGLPACCGDGYPNFRGFFYELRENAVVRNLTLENVDVSGKAFVGALAGVNYGKISNVHVTGTVSGNTDVGGLVGFNRASGVITASSVTASVEGRATLPDGGRNVGGLTGLNQGTIRASHAGGAVSGLANNTGGLVGYNDGGSIIAAYAAGPAYTEGLNAGGLAGRNRGNITASYSIGYPAGCGAAAGGLVGHHAAGAVIDSYWDTQTSGYTTSPVGAAKTTSELQTPAGYAGIYAAWNVDVNGDGNADDPWDFGTSAQYPVLKYGNLDPAGQRTAIAARPPAPTQAQDRANRAPTLAAPLGDIAFSRDGGARQISLGGRFHDIDCGDDLAITARSSDGAVATVSMAADGSSLTVNALSQGTATITVTASDGRGGAVSDHFTVKVKAVPQLRSDLNDVDGLIAGHTREILVMLRDDDGPNPRAVSSDSSVVTASLQSTDQGHAWCPTSNFYCYTLTVKGIGGGTATVTVTARDSDGNQVSGAFQVSVTAPSDDDATLKALGMSRGSLAFDPAQTAYTVNLPFTARSVTLFPVATSPNAVVTVNGETPGTPLSLSYGETVVNNVVVTAADGETTKTYRVTVSRESSDHVFVTASYDLWSDADDDMTLLGLDLPAGLSLGSKFQSSQYIYDVSVPDEMDNLTFAGIFDPHTKGIKGPPHPAFGILAVGDNLPLFEESILEGKNFQLRQDYLIANSSVRGGIHRIALEMDAITVIEIGVYKTRLGDWFGFAPPDEATMGRKIVYTLNVTRGTPPSGQQGAGSYSLSPAQTSAAEGQAAELTISLSKPAPTGGVAFTVTPRYDGDATASAADVGSVTSTVTVEAGSRNLSFSIPTVNDALEETDETFTVVVAADTIGWRKAGDGKDKATVTVTDDDTPGITVTAANPLAITEGQGGSYTVALESQPTKDVTITPQSADVGAVLVTPPRYEFTPFAWNTPVTFYVSGVADDDGNDESVAISHLVTTEDTRYASLAVPSVSVAVSDTTPPQLQQANNAPTVVSAIDDATITSEDGTHQASLSGVFSDADGDDLTITAASSDTAVATVSVAADYSTLTVSAQARGTATVTVTAADGYGGEAADTFTVTVKAAPVVASAIADISGLEAEDSRTISMSGVFSDADGDAVTVTQASSSDTSIAAVSVAIDGATAAITAVTVTAGSEGTATIRVTAQDADGNTVQDAFDVTVNAAAQQLQKANNPPTVSSPMDDATIVNESGTHEASLSGVFSDADGDDLTITASSSDENVATVSVSADHSTLTVTAQARGTATITVTAADGYGGTVEDNFTLTVKAAPVVAAAIDDVSELYIDATHEVALTDVPSDADEEVLTDVFTDADGDALTITAESSDTEVLEVATVVDESTRTVTGLTVTGVAEGTATVTVTAEDADGNRVSDEFDVTVVESMDSEFLDDEAVPGPVASLTLTADGTKLIVSWEAPAPESGGEVRGYIVHLKPDGGGKGRTKTPKAKKSQVSFENLEAGQTYKVWVRAQNAAGKGERVHASITLPEAAPPPEEGDGQTGQ